MHAACSLPREAVQCDPLVQITRDNKVLSIDPYFLSRHHMTVLDGEMVVDHLPDQGLHQRNYLAYDCLMLDGKQLQASPFHVSTLHCMTWAHMGFSFCLSEDLG